MNFRPASRDEAEIGTISDGLAVEFPMISVLPTYRHGLQVADLVTLRWGKSVMDLRWEC